VREGKALAVRVGDCAFMRPAACGWAERKRRDGFLAECITLFATIEDGWLTVSYSDVEGAREFTYPTHKDWTIEWELTGKCEPTPRGAGQKTSEDEIASRVDSLEYTQGSLCTKALYHEQRIDDGWEYVHRLRDGQTALAERIDKLDADRYEERAGGKGAND